MCCAGDHTGPLGVQAQAVAAFQLRLLKGFGAAPAAQLLFHATTGRELGHGLLPEITALVEFHPVGQAQFIGIGVSVELGIA